ncbi:DUF2087 domain-containing protein [Ornithinibacillus sp. L9]|uniref:DUF2087 domain-containing protein n=1 Tax=Ornithinibacillus caprae TaxID=2678566 RepID=A0A6N8FKT1_9BACI|nr:DUF2087 domain-containing protein [Ornithinibacillus caprae]MUK88597.1 DUF2087 domain-containing protein [Ornithinibacillus caprae]
MEELKTGFTYDPSLEVYQCIICEKTYQQGIIYPIDGTLYEAKLAMRHHIQNSHQSMFHYLVGMDKKYTGLSDLQKEIISYFKEGLTDKEIAKKLDAGSTSTIRTHRFKLKEKEKQARVFLAIMDLLKQEDHLEQDLITIHKGATMVDERYAITNAEKEKVLSTYFKQGLDGPLHSFPSKEKRKIIILQHLVTKFSSNRKYTEKEVNEILKTIHSDFVTIRRYLIEYGFMDRSKDGSEYWII